MTKKWTLALGAALGVAFTGGAQAADKVTLQLAWENHIAAVPITLK